jgi:glycosyltransferase involved in cell wall biosynthesis
LGGFGAQGHNHHRDGVGNVKVKLGVVALAGSDNGGTYQYTLAVLQALQHAIGFDITMYGDPQNPDFAELGYPIYPFAESRRQQLTALLADRLHVSLPDPFASEDILLAPIYSLTLLHTSRPFVYTLHDLQEKYYPKNFPWWLRLWRHQVHARLLGRARRVLCESRRVQMDIIRSFDVPKERAVVMAAPPMRHFLAEESSEKLEAVKLRLGLPDRFLFYPAHFWVHKNHLRLIEAFREVVNEVPDLNLVLTGKRLVHVGKQRDAYDLVLDAIDKCGLNERVRLLGYVKPGDLQAIYKLATALVMPSLFESVSIPVYEAFQVGTAVVASNILGIPEQVGDAGLLFDPNSVSSIKEAILKIVGDREARRLFGQRGRERMLAMTSERFGAELQSLLSALTEPTKTQT